MSELFSPDGLASHVLLFEAFMPFMEITDPDAKCFHKHFVKQDVLYIFPYISGHIWPLLGAVAKSSM